MVTTRRNSDDDVPNFEAMIAAAVANALPNLTAALRTQITNDIRNGAESSGGSGGDATPQGIHVWIERFTKLKPLAFRSAVTPAEAEDWITHMEKLFQVLGCPDNFKTRLAAFKLEGDALSWWKAHLRTQVGGDAFADNVLGCFWKSFTTGIFSDICTTTRCSEAELDISRWVKEVGFRRIRYYGVRRKVAQGCAAARNMKLFVHEMGNSISVIEMRNRFIMGTGANRNKGRHDQGNFRVPGPEVNGSAGPERRSTETLPPSTSLYYLIVPSKTEAEYANRFLLTASLLQDEFYATTLISAKTSGRIRLQFAFLFKCLDFDVDYRAWMVASHRATMVFLASVMDTSVGEEIEYGIKSNSQSEPISKAPYRMAPVELKELKESVTEMLENGLLDPVFHRGVTASSFLGRIVSQQHHMDSTKVKAITKRPRPDLVTEDSFRGIETGIVVCSILTLPSGSVVFPDLQPMILSVAAVVFALKIWRHILPSGKANVDLQMPLSRKSVLTSSKQIKEAQKGRWRVVAIVSECEDGKHTSSGVDDGGVVCLKIGDVFPNDQTLARSYDGQPHSSPFTIHPGSTKMYRDLKQYFWWNGMKQDVAIRWRFLCGNGNEIPWNFVTGLAYYQKDMMRLGGCLIGLTSLLISYPFEETKVVGPELIEITNEKVAVAKEKLKEARSRQKSYADKHRRNLEFQVGDRIQPDNVLCPSSLNPSGSSERSHDKHTIIPFCEDSLKNHPEREATWETGRIYASFGQEGVIVIFCGVSLILLCFGISHEGTKPCLDAPLGITHVEEEFEAYLASNSFPSRNDDLVDYSLKEFADELALITFPSGNDDLPVDTKFDLREIEYLLNHDPIEEMDSILEDLVDKNSHDDNLVDTISEMFTDEHALDYSSPPLWDDYDDELFDLESDNDDVYDDPFDSKEDKIKESKLLIDELDPPRSSDFLPSPKCDSVFYEDFSEVNALPSTDNEDKVFNPGILIHENLFEITIRVTNCAKNVKKTSNASLILEDFNPPLYELPFHKEVPGLGALLSFSSERKKFSTPGFSLLKEFILLFSRN
ncbi:reverse transcriptase domain-containing protein [Tanacetum coccineum]|uniref:Reverse transcriptase domain-containing protein n=1 Tax=Tanacetum coccineum TaxID=301880 RepID=A0ABQ5G4L1_9ASTR